MPAGGGVDPARSVEAQRAITPTDAVSSAETGVVIQGGAAGWRIRHMRADVGARCRWTTQYQ